MSDFDPATEARLLALARAELVRRGLDPSAYGHELLAEGPLAVVIFTDRDVRPGDRSAVPKVPTLEVELDPDPVRMRVLRSYFAR